MAFQETTEEQLQPPADAIGLIQLYPDPNKRSNPSLDVIAVHGLGGDAYKTWTADDGTLWIRDLLPSSPWFKDARILSYGYDATAFLHPFAQPTTGRTFTFAEALLSDVADKRSSAAERKRPIIFIGHSLGGIVIKAALRHAHALRGQFGSILDSTKAIMFFGTPHQGSDTAKWATFLGDIGWITGLRNTQVVDELKRWSNPLVELTALFSELATQFKITTFFEQRKLHGVLVVPEGTARMGINLERVRGLDSDHKSIVKFTKKDPNWPIVLARLEALATEIQEGVGITLPEAPTLPPSRQTGMSEEEVAQRMENLRGA